MASGPGSAEARDVSSSSEAGPSSWSPLKTLGLSATSNSPANDDSDDNGSQWSAQGLQAARQRAYRVQRRARESLARHSPSIGPDEALASNTSLAMDTANQGLRLKRRVLRKLKSGVDQEQDYDDNDDDDDDDEEGRDDSGEGVLATLHDLKRKGEELVGGEEEAEEEESAVSAAFLVSYFLAGGAAGATSRTVVSPLERLKIIMQVQPKSMKGDTKPHKGAYSGVVSGLVKMWQEEGFKGFMRGNGINCLRIAPYSAVQFSSYEILKNYLKDKDGELDVPRRLTAGALAGIASVVSTYPLDLVRSRISIASASLYADAKAATGSLSEPPVDSKPKRKPSRAEVRRIIEERQKKVPGIWAMTVKVYREEGGIRALYKGCVPTSAGVAPYVAINFAAYEALRKRLANEDGEISTVRKLSCGALAGSISQTLTYPLDVLRRRMQVSGMKDSKLGYSDKSSFAAIRTIVTREGFFGLYRGIVPNLLKVAPSIGTSFVTYEFVQQLVHPHPPHHHHDNSSETNNGNGHSKHH